MCVSTPDRNLVLLVLSISFTLVTASLLSSFAAVVNPHGPDAPCSGCHLAEREVTPANAHQLLMGQETLCGRCHQSAVRMSHPSGFPPGRSLPAAYPVDWKGDLTCSTCHTLHSGTRGLLRARESGRTFCLACHEQAFFEEMPDKGISIEQLGHLDARTQLEFVSLDVYSMQCLTCHSDKAEDGPEVTVDPRGVLRHAGGKVNHPIGVLYSEAEIFGGYRPESQLSRAIFLPQGRVACVSCHEGYAKQHGTLVVVRQGSRLCYACHDL